MKPSAKGHRLSTRSPVIPPAGSPSPASAGADPIEGRLLHIIHSPRGEPEGALIDRDGAPLQLVFDRHDHEAGAVFAAIAPGQRVSVLAALQGPSAKGAGAHPVYAFGRLLSVDGKKPGKAKRPPPLPPAYCGRVARLNHARHGAPNGVVLDTGDFIHTRPDGMVRLKLKVGDAVTADGDAHRMADGSGWVVEATRVNGKPLTSG